MATMALDMINPYSKYGLKRRPTYDEIAGLTGENETLTGSLPDRRATFFKASPEGSFFDGLDHLEVLKEQQHRIQERQMRELLLRHNLGGGTVHVERMRQQSRDTTPIEAETPRDDNVNNASIQAQLQERSRMAQEREQQTGQAHQSLLSRSATPVIDIISGGLSRTSSRVGTPMAQPVPQLAIDLTQDNPQTEDEVMMTAREEREALNPNKQY